MLDKFADELREQREKSGLTLQQMATKTRIDIKFLEAIDQGNFAFLPDLYVKAFVKQYSKTIGLDENLMIKKFEAAKEGKEYSQAPPVIEEEPADQIVDDSTSVPISSDSLYLTFFAKETSWVFVVLDNNRTQEFTLSPNSKFSVAASREFKATVGNSGGVTLQMNNQAVDFTGRAGSVRYFKLDRNGIVYLNTPPKLEQQ